MQKKEASVIFDKIVGHKNQVASLKKAFASGLELPSRALLFSGPSGIGKKLVARAWAQGLLCENSKKPCGKCPSCLKIEKGHHPDLLMVGLTEGATLKIEQIRDVQNFVSLRAYEGHGKVIIIDDAQTLTPQASNSLLKTLEEPNPGCNFVLITSNKSAIISTIQSRCQKILFGALEPSEMKKILPDAEEWTLRLSQGRVDQALKLNDESYKKLKTSALRVLRDLTKVRIFEGFTSLVPLFEERETALFTTQCWSRWIVAACSKQLGGTVSLDSEEEPIIEALASTCPAKVLLKLGQKILRLEQDIQANINKALAFEKFWLDAQKEMVTNVSR